VLVGLNFFQVLYFDANCLLLALSWSCGMFKVWLFRMFIATERSEGAVRVVLLFRLFKRTGIVLRFLLGTAF